MTVNNIEEKYPITSRNTPSGVGGTEGTLMQRYEYEETSRSETIMAVPINLKFGECREHILYKTRRRRGIMYPRALQLDISALGLKQNYLLFS